MSTADESKRMPSFKEKELETLEDNKGRARRIPLEIFNRGNLNLVDHLVTRDFIDHTYAPSLGLAPGPDGVKQLVTLMRKAFPDLQHTLFEEIAEDDKVVHLHTSSGTHKGELMGIPPTGKKATWLEAHIVRMTGGKMAEHWAVVDELSLLRQLGVIPSMGPVKIPLPEESKPKGKPLPIHQHKTIIRHLLEDGFNKGQLKVIDKTIASDFINHTPFPGEKSGLEGFKHSASLFKKAFPDARESIVDMIAEDDKVVVQGLNTGTQEGEFLGIAPTRAKINADEIDIFKFDGDKIVEGWLLFDGLGLMRQLGVALPTGPGKK